MLQWDLWTVISDSEEKAEKLSDFFCSVFTKENNSDMLVPDSCFVGWRTANIMPLFKNGKRSQAENYQPVNLTSQICKIVESVSELFSHLEKYNLIKDSQHGFRK